MRDLKIDLEICKIAERAYQRNKTKSGKEIAETAARIALGKYARQGWPEAIERAIKAEEEVERLKDEVIYQINIALTATKEAERLKEILADEFIGMHHAITGD